jgi:hypothetical protein
MSCVPLPWWTSQSRIATRARPSSACAYLAATAALSKMQKPIAEAGRAWWPGGRASAKPPISTAVMAAPAESNAASNVVSDAGVSASSHVAAEIERTSSTYCGAWQRSIASTGAGSASRHSGRAVCNTRRRSGVSG